MKFKYKVRQRVLYGKEPGAITSRFVEESDVCCECGVVKKESKKMICYRIKLDNGDILNKNWFNNLGITKNQLSGCPPDYNFFLVFEKQLKPIK